MKDKKFLRIKCPNCGREYLPAEIYIPNAFFGRPNNIERDSFSGAIRDFYGKDMDLVEHYICDNCNTPFKVSAKVQFVTTEEDKYNFDKDYSINLKKQSLFLSEE